MADPIASQLRRAWQARGLTLAALCEGASLACGPDSLCRKLAGKQPLTTTEAEQLADYLRVRLSWAPRVRRERAA